MAWTKQAAERIAAATKRNEQAPRGTAGAGAAARPAVYPGTCVFAFVSTSTITAATGTAGARTTGSGTANIIGVNAAGTEVTLRTGVTVRNRYTTSIPSGTAGTCYVDGPHLVVDGWEC